MVFKGEGAVNVAPPRDIYAPLECETFQENTYLYGKRGGPLVPIIIIIKKRIYIMTASEKNIDKMYKP